MSELIVFVATLNDEQIALFRGLGEIKASEVDLICDSVLAARKTPRRKKRQAKEQKPAK